MFTNKTFLIFSSLALLILFGRFWVYFVSQERNQDKSQVEGVVSSQPQARFNKIQFNLNNYVVVTDYIEVSVGDRVRVWGSIEKNKLDAEKVEIVTSSSLQGNLIRFRESLVSRINTYLPMKESGLLAGILLGSKNALSRENKAKLVSTGTLHIVVVSGYNIVLVASFFLAFARYFGRKRTTLLALIAITLYSLLVGLEPPTMRALIMGAISLLAVLFGRQSQAFYALGLACLLMLLIDPSNLVDISFQLTVSATLGIIIFTKLFLKLLVRLPNFFRETTASTLAAQILVLPLIFYYFGNVSLMAPLVNTLVLWVIPLVTLLGFSFLLITYVSGFGAILVSTLIYLPLKYFFVVIDFFSELDWLVLKFSEPNILVVIGYYLIVFAVGLRFRKDLVGGKQG